MAKQKEECPEYEISSGNVFADLGLEQSDELLARAKLLNDVSTLIKNSGLSQKDVAERLGITQTLAHFFGHTRMSPEQAGS